MNTIAAITEYDLLAYVDGRVAPARRAEIERHLKDHPDDAERVALDLAIQRGLRLLLSGG
jgi:anti-sigma factor RsiW